MSSSHPDAPIFVCFPGVGTATAAILLAGTRARRSRTSVCCRRAYGRSSMTLSAGGVGAVFPAAAPSALLALIAILFIKEVSMGSRVAVSNTPRASDLTPVAGSPSPAANPCACSGC